MSVEDAIAAARQERVVLLVGAERSADEVVRAASDAVLVRAADLVLGAPAVEPETPLVVVDSAAAVAGLVPGLWCGPWTLAAFLRHRRPGGVVLVDALGYPEIEDLLARHLTLQRIGADPTASAEPEAGAEVAADEVARLLDLGRGEPRQVLDEADAALLFDLALTGAVEEAWRVPFLVHVVDHRRFKRPFVEDDDQIERFHTAYDRFVATLGMLEGARYQLNGRQPRDLRELADAVEIPVRELVWIFRWMDHRKVVVSRPVEEGLGERPNLEIVIGGGDSPDPAAAARAVAALRAIRGTLAVPTPERVEERPVEESGLSGEALFSSLRDAPSLGTEAASRPPPPPPTRAPARPKPPAEELPTHLPGLDSLARGDLIAARAALGAVQGELRAEALLLASFRYDLLDVEGTARRRFVIPEVVRGMLERALELEQVPAERLRLAMDEEFPGAFVEVPGPGHVEVFFEEGPLVGTHRFRELPGRARFETPLLTGRRAAQATLAAGDAVDLPAGPADPGWTALAEALRLRDAGSGTEAHAALEEVDLDLDLEAIRLSIIRVLPEDHPQRLALERQETEERERRALGTVLEGIERALEEGRVAEQDGFGSLARAVELGVVDRLAELLRRRMEDDPAGVGPALWLGRVEARRGDFEGAREALGRAARCLGGGPRPVQWRFEVVEAALRTGAAGAAWDTVQELLRDGSDPREIDQQFERLFRDGVLTVRDHDEIRGRFEARELRRLPRTDRRLKRQDTLEPWKKALQGVLLDD